MTVSDSVWAEYVRKMRAIDKTAARMFEAYLNTHEYDSEVGRNAALDYAYALATKYGESSAALSCEMYDAVAEAAGMHLPAAEPAATATYGEVARTVNGMMKQSENTGYISSGVERLVKQAGADTTMKNAARDGAEWAWIPRGDTCSFCIMLASNGWQKASRKTLKGDHAEHIHANCDCQFAIRFDGKPSYASYDPDKYLQIYNDAEGDTWQEKLNSMRKAERAANKDKINAQKRAAYARRTEKKRLQEEMKHGTIYGDRDYVFAAKEPGDASKPVGLHGDYQDFKELDISEDTRKTLRELNGLAIETNEEHGLAVYQGGKTDIQTKHDHSRVTIYYPKNAKHVEIYHCHTDDSVLSLEDIFESATKLNVDRECVISVNGDVWMIDYSEGIRPGEEEFKRAYKMCNDSAKLALEEDPAFNNWEFEERYYMLGRETMLRVARLFEWNIMGGDING